MSESIYEYEPVRGLPGNLPDGERIVWQGSPIWRTIAVHFCHVRFVALYFAVLIAWAIAATVSDGRPLTDAAGGVVALTILCGVIVALLCMFAFGIAQTTIYTITNKRLILRYGVALTKAINVPFKSIGGAQLRKFGDGTGDIAITIAGNEKLAYLLLWPHARPWCFKRPEPMLRGIPNAAAVAEQLRLAVAPGNVSASEPIVAVKPIRDRERARPRLVKAA